MASALHAPPITIEQYLGFESPNGYRDELVYGRIILSPDPKPLHLDVAENIYHLLKTALGKKYKVGQRINLRFPMQNSMPSADVFVISQKEWNRAAAAGGYPNGSEAILAVEVVSPGNRQKSMQQKADLYRRHGIEVWVVDPGREEVKVFREKEVLTFSSKADTEIPLPGKLSEKSIKISGVFKVPYR